MSSSKVCESSLSFAFDEGAYGCFAEIGREKGGELRLALAKATWRCRAPSCPAASRVITWDTRLRS